MNLVDFTHSLLTGEWKLRREMVREDRSFRAATLSRRMQLYAGAKSTIARPGPHQLSSPEDYREAAERIVLIRAARQLEEDGGFFDGILDDFETYVVGDQLVYMPNTGNPEADKVIRDYTDWQFDQADYSERKDLTKIAQLAVREFKRDGECGQIPRDVGDAIKLQGVPGDCIGNPMTGAAGDRNFTGIIVDEESGSPVSFQIFKRNPKRAMYVLDREIPANQFWHYCDPFRMQQYHGVTCFKSAIRDGFDIDQILEFTKLNIKWRSSQLPTVHTETGRPRGSQFGYFGINAPAGAPTTDSGAPAARSINVDGVVSNYLNLEEKVMEYPNDFPNAQLQVTIEQFRRQCCKGAKLPYEFVYAADNGGVVQRFWVNKAENTFEKDKHLLRRTLLNPYKNRVIQKGIDTGELDLRRFGDLDVSLERYRGTWQMGKAISVDYGRENDTDMALIDAGLMSAQEKAASVGRNLDEIDNENEAHVRKVFSMAARTAKEFGVTIQETLPYYSKKFPNPVMSPAAAKSGEIPGEIVEAGGQKALIESIGIGGSQALTQILAQVASGAIPRESGINTLTIVFGISPENAARLIPPQSSAKPVPGANDLPEVAPLT